MSRFILIPKDVLRFAVSDLLLNIDSIVTMVAREEREYPLIEISLGVKDLLIIKFNDNDIRNEFFQFITTECKPLSLAIKSEVMSKTEKKRRGTTRD